MFSEYASRFLAQSQSRLSTFSQTENDRLLQQATERQSRTSRLGGRAYFGRGFGSVNPYQPSGSRFGTLLGSRYASHDAPLFQTAIEHEEDEEERDREAADLYALQRSRRVLAASRLDESTETENDGSQGSVDADSQEAERHSRSRSRGKGIQSSWNGTQSLYRQWPDKDSVTGSKRLTRDTPGGSSESGGDRMVDIGLDSHIDDRDPPEDLTVETLADSTPPAFQEFRATSIPSRLALQRKQTLVSESGAAFPPPDSVDTNLGLALTSPTPSDAEIFRHDAFFAWIYLIAIASMLATFVLVFLHTSTPSGKKPWGDTIYTTLTSSFHLLAVDTLVAIVVSLVWLACLRSFVRHLVIVVLVAVPIILFSFSLYPFISSFDGPGGGRGIQDRVMRWAAVVPGIAGGVWIYLVWNGRMAITRAVDILDFSSRILNANSTLILVGMVCLGLIVLWTWVWLAMFTRVFLGGHFAPALSRFVISASTWWLGVYFVLMYVWTLSIISGVQRATTAATVSQWYFHRNIVPAPSSSEVVSAALNHSVTTIFGSICLSTLLALAIRLPLLVFPRRLANLLGAFAYSFVPTPIAAITNPLTLTYAAIHSQTLAMSARGLSTMDFLTPQAPTTTLTPRAFSSRRGAYAPLLPYRLAKLILHASRFIMATALGFAGWVITARQLQIRLPDGPGARGSAYAYVVGLIASFIGWGILGAMEGILSGILDAVVVCYGSEKRMLNAGAGYCMEAANLFEDRRNGLGEEEIY